MRTVLLIPLFLTAALGAQPPASKPTAEPKPAPEAATMKPHAEVKVGTGVEKLEITGEATDFKVPAGTKLYAWTKVWGGCCTGSTRWDCRRTRS